MRSTDCKKSSDSFFFVRQESSCAVLKYLVREYGVENRELTPREKHVAREIMRLLDQTEWFKEMMLTWMVVIELLLP